MNPSSAPSTAEVLLPTILESVHKNYPDSDSAAVDSREQRARRGEDNWPDEHEKSDSDSNASPATLSIDDNRLIGKHRPRIDNFSDPFVSLSSEDEEPKREFRIHANLHKLKVQDRPRTSVGSGSPTPRHPRANTYRRNLGRSPREIPIGSSRAVLSPVSSSQIPYITPDFGDLIPDTQALSLGRHNRGACLRNKSKPKPTSEDSKMVMTGNTQALSQSMAGTTINDTDDELRPMPDNIDADVTCTDFDRHGDRMVTGCEDHKIRILEKDENAVGGYRLTDSWRAHHAYITMVRTRSPLYQ